MKTAPTELQKPPPGHFTPLCAFSRSAPSLALFQMTSPNVYATQNGKLQISQRLSARADAQLLEHRVRPKRERKKRKLKSKHAEMPSRPIPTSSLQPPQFKNTRVLWIARKIPIRPLPLSTLHQTLLRRSNLSNRSPQPWTFVHSRSMLHLHNRHRWIFPLSQLLPLCICQFRQPAAVHSITIR